MEWNGIWNPIQERIESNFCVNTKRKIFAPY